MGGGSGRIHNAVIISTTPDDPDIPDDQNSAIPLSVYSGDILELNNVTLLSLHSEAYSIDNQYNERHADIRITGACYANRPINEAMNIVAGRDLLRSYPVQHLTADKNLKGKYKNITLHWEGSPGLVDIHKDDVLIAVGVPGSTYIDTFRGGFKEAVYKVFSTIATLAPWYNSIAVTRK